MEIGPRSKSATMYENLETLTEAQIKIRDLENELALSNLRVAQCEKEKCDLTVVIEKLHEKFIDKPLDDQIDQLELNLALLIDAAKFIEQEYEELSNSKNDLEIATVEDVTDRSQIETESSTEVTDSANLNNLITSSNDHESIADDQYSVENETSVNTDDLLAKIKESLKRMLDGVDKVCDKMSNSENNLTTTPDIRNNEIITINCDEDEDDANHADNQPVSRPNTISRVIELDDSSCSSDSDDCLILSDNSNIGNDSTAHQQEANSTSDFSDKSSLVDDDSWVFPSLNDDSDSNSTDEQLDNSFDPSAESRNLSAHLNENSSLRSNLSDETAYSKIGRKRTSFSGVLQDEFDDSSFQSTRKFKQPQNDDLTRKEIKEKLDIECESRAPKRAKHDIRESNIPPSTASLSPSNSTTSSKKKIRKNRMSSWPCPLCAECSSISNLYSIHLNEVHVGHRGVFTCSICRFVSPSIPAYKRHMKKYHKDAFLKKNRYRYLHRLNVGRSTKTNFNSKGITSRVPQI